MRNTLQTLLSDRFCIQSASVIGPSDTIQDGPLWEPNLKISGSKADVAFLDQHNQPHALCTVCDKNISKYASSTTCQCAGTLQGSQRF